MIKSRILIQDPAFFGGGKSSHSDSFLSHWGVWTSSSFSTSTSTGGGTFTVPGMIPGMPSIAATFLKYFIFLGFSSSIINILI